MKNWIVVVLVTVAITIFALQSEAKYVRYSDSTRALNGLKGQPKQAEWKLMNELNAVGQSTDSSPQALKDFLNYFDFTALGLSLQGEYLNFTRDAQNRLTGITRGGATYVTFDYAANGLLNSITDRVNCLKTEYSTTDSFTYNQTSVANDPNYKYKYQQDTFNVTSGGAGKMKDIVMTDSNGNVLTGNTIRTTGGSSGYLTFAEGSPIVPVYSGSLPPTGTMSYSGPIVAKSFEYYPDGTLKGEVSYEWSSGRQYRTDSTGKIISAGYAAGRYAYESTTYKQDGTVDQKKYYNDPAPVSYEPTFTGTLVQDKYGQITMQVTQAIDDKGVAMPQCVGKSYLLTTRHDATDSQPAANQWSAENLQSAIDGGAQAFKNAGISNLIGHQLTLQGQLLTDIPTVAATGQKTQAYSNGTGVDIFSAFNLLSVM